MGEVGEAFWQCGRNNQGIVGALEQNRHFQRKRKCQATKICRPWCRCRKSIDLLTRSRMPELSEYHTANRREVASFLTRKMGEGSHQILGEKRRLIPGFRVFSKVIERH